VGVSQTAATTGSQSLLELKQVVSLVTQQKTARSALLAASTIAHLDHPMTELKEKSGQISLATAREKPIVQSARAGQTDLPTEIETQIHAVLNHAVPIQEVSVSQPHVQIVLGNQDHLLPAQTLTVLGNHVLQDLTDQTDLPMTETHLTETTQTVPSVQLAQTLTALGSHVLQDQIDQSAEEIPEDSLLVQTHESMTGTATLTARTASQEIAQEMRAS
jgi:hypothetical protein